MRRHMNERLNQLVMWIFPGAGPRKLTGSKGLSERKAKKRLRKERREIQERERKARKAVEMRKTNACLVYTSVSAWRSGSMK